MTVAEIMEAVKELKVMELSELVKALEEEFGVSATPVAVAGAVAGGDGAAARRGYGYRRPRKPDRRSHAQHPRPHAARCPRSPLSHERRAHGVGSGTHRR